MPLVTMLLFIRPGLNFYIASVYQANPFIAKIVGGKCECVPPMVCDA